MTTKKQKRDQTKKKATREEERTEKERWEEKEEEGDKRRSSVMNNTQTKPRGRMGSPAYHHSELSITRPSVRHGLHRQGHGRLQKSLAQERSNKQ